MWRLDPLGRAVGKQIVVPHIMDTLLKRFQLLKRIAEGPDWERYLVSAPNSPSAPPLATEVGRIQGH